MRVMYVVYIPLDLDPDIQRIVHRCGLPLTSVGVFGTERPLAGCGSKPTPRLPSSVNGGIRKVYI